MQSPSSPLPILIPLLAALCALPLGSSPSIASWSTIETPGPPVGLFADNGWVDEDGEVAKIEAILVADGQRVSRFTGIGFDVDPYSIVVIPELEFAALDSALSPTAASNLQAFVQSGGVLVTCRDIPGRDHALLSTLFGWSGLASGETNPTTNLNASNATGTPFAAGTASLPGPSATGSTQISTLPAGAVVLYDNGTDATVWAKQEGTGWVVSLGWDFFAAAPLGTVDGGGWQEVLLATTKLNFVIPADVGIFLSRRYVDNEPGEANAEASNMEAVLRGLNIPVRGLVGRDDLAHVSIFADDTVVDYDPASPNGSQSEGIAIESGLVERGHEVLPFSGTTNASFNSGTGVVEVLVLPELENADLLPLLDAAALDTLQSFIRSGGTLVLFGDAQGRSIALANALLISSIVQTDFVASGTADLVASSAAGTPFDGGTATIPLQDATAVVAESTLPARARPLYTTTADEVAAFLVPVWNGGIVWLGWDFFAAAPDGNADGGWRDLLDRTLELRGRFETDLPDTDVFVIPEIEGGADLEVDLSPTALASLTNFVSSGGRLVVGGGNPARDLLNGVFGWSLATLSSTTSFSKQAAAVGTDFESGPATLPNPSLTRPLDQTTLPTNATALYEDDGEVGVASFAVGDGEVLYLAWDYFSSEPVGAIGGEWVEILELSVPEPGFGGALLVGGLGLTAFGRRRLARCKARSLRTS